MTHLKFKNAVAKLRKEAQSMQYYENMGQKELREYQEWLFKNFSYSEANKYYQAAVSEIDSL